MSNVLLVLSSPRIGESVSTKYATELATKIAAKAGNTLTTRDVAAHPLPSLDAVLIAATRSGKTELNTQEKAALDRAMMIVNEAKAADIIVIGAATMNFGPTTCLKGWIDHLAVPRQTFQYGANGPEGLIKDKKVYVVTTSSGIYGDGPGDYLTPWLAYTLGFMGMTDVEFIKMDGLAYGPQAVEKATNAANEKIAAIAA